MNCNILQSYSKLLFRLKFGKNKTKRKLKPKLSKYPRMLKTKSLWVSKKIVQLPNMQKCDIIIENIAIKSEY